MKILLIVILIAVGIALPVSWIWAVNTLFSLSIPLTFKTWCASLLIGGLLSAPLSHARS
jgi:hypothetical protein